MDTPADIPSTTAGVYWQDTILRIGTEQLDDLLLCMMSFRRYLLEHGTARGFGWYTAPPDPPAPPEKEWYELLTAWPFRAKAKVGCKVYVNAARLGTVEFLTQSVFHLTPKIVNDGRVLDVQEVWAPDGRKPHWFRVWPDAAHHGAVDQWCLASDAEQIA